MKIALSTLQILRLVLLGINNGNIEAAKALVLDAIAAIEQYEREHGTGTA